MFTVIILNNNNNNKAFRGATVTKQTKLQVYQQRVILFVIISLKFSYFLTIMMMKQIWRLLNSDSPWAVVKRWKNDDEVKKKKCTSNAQYRIIIMMMIIKCDCNIDYYIRMLYDDEEEDEKAEE